MLLRIAAVAVAGAALFEAGTVNGQLQLRPSPIGALFTVALVAASLALIGIALTGTGRGAAEGVSPPELVGPMRAVFAFVSVVSLSGLVWLGGGPVPPV